MRFLKFFTILSVLFIQTFPISAQDNQLQSAKVISVGDGDTISVVNNDQKIIIRLACIDAPEQRQAWGKQATDSLKELLPIGKNIFYRAIQSDRYQRLVAEVFVDNQSVNLQMVREGQVVVYRKYLEACKFTQNQYLTAELNAKNDHLNFWSQTNPVMHWEYRHPVISAINTQVPISNSPVNNLSKNPKCRDFSSQLEVKNFLTKHPEYWGRLDRDNDGVACESIRS
jgi:micrococcal nuclease